MSGFTTVLDQRGLQEVGSHSDPGRRRHWTPLGPLRIRAHLHSVLQPFTGEAPPAPGSTDDRAIFITLADLLTCSESGAYYQACAARGEPGNVCRPPHLLIRHTASASDLAAPVAGVNWHEAGVLAHLLGGRLPDQKEADYLITSGIRRLPEQAAYWTSSAYGEFDYSYCRYERASGLWIADDQVKQPEPEDPGASTVFIRTAQGLTRQAVQRSASNLDLPPDNLALLVIVVFN